jgi:hypothetical protein
MTYTQLIDIALTNFPGCIVFEHSNGKLVIETGLLNVKHDADAELVPNTGDFE